MPPSRSLNRRQFLCCSVTPIMSVVPIKADAQPIKTRRIVTGVNAEGKSKIIADATFSQQESHLHRNKLQARTMWLENQLPARTDSTETLKDYTFMLEPPATGVIVHIITCEAGFVSDHHKTKTIDFIFVISGSIELIMDEGKTLVSAGDTVIQRATLHSWRVVGDQPCILAAVLIGAEA